MREAQPAEKVNSASMERTTLELPLYGATVYASLAPAQPPPPAGLASGLTCIIHPVVTPKKLLVKIPGIFGVDE
jgi:hypothetical protein